MKKTQIFTLILYFFLDVGFLPMKWGKKQNPLQKCRGFW